MTTDVHNHEGSTDGVARPVMELELTNVTVAAGQSARVKITLTNVGAVVETYQLTVLGPASQWCSVVPAEVALFPGDQGSATLIIRPPASTSTVAGTYRVGVLATSEVRRTVQTATEVTVTVPSFVRIRSTAPRGTIDFKGHTTVYLQLANEGNSTVDCSVEATDPDGILRIKPAVDKVTLRPAETTWIKTAVKGPLVLFGSSRTRSMNAEFNVILDHFSDKAPDSVPAQTDHLNLIQKPRFRLRLGLLGRLAILLAILALIATFLYSRILAPHDAGSPGAPNVPQDFVAQVVDDSQIVFTWGPASGASGYEIYAVGAAGDPTPSASAAASAGASDGSASTAASASASASVSASASTSTAASSGSASASASASVSPSVSGRSLVIAGAVAGVGQEVSAKKKASASATAKASASDSASASKETTTSSSASSSNSTSTSSSATSTASLPQVLTSAEASTLNSPVCLNCTKVVTVDGSATRAVLQPLPKVAQACYRIIAKSGNFQSLFSVPQCVNLAVVQARQSSASASASASSASASASSASASASAAKVKSCPPVDTAATASSSTSAALQWVAATKAPSSGSSSDCKADMTITGFEIQRQILSGWSDLPSQPSANDTAFEATGLPAGTKQCFRIRSLTANGGSDYTSAFCATLPAASSASASASAS